MNDMAANLELAKEIVSSCCSNDDSLYGTMFLICYGMLAKFGDVYSPLIRKLFLTTEVVVDDKPITTLLDECGYSPEDLYGGEDLNNQYFTTSAVSFPGDDIWFEDDGRVRYYRNRPELFCSTTGKDYNEVLNSLVHEFCHLLKGMVNYIKMDDFNFFSIRSGLNVFGGKIDQNGELQQFDENLILDEVINVFQTTDTMMEIGKLNGIMLPDEVRCCFLKLDLNRMNELYGYDYGTAPLKKLWANPHFKSVVEENIIIGKIDKIRDDFNEMVGRNYFKMLSRHLNLLEYAEDEDEQAKLTSFITTIVRIYNLRTKGIIKIKK